MLATEKSTPAQTPPEGVSPVLLSPIHGLISFCHHMFLSAAVPWCVLRVFFVVLSLGSSGRLFFWVLGRGLVGWYVWLFSGFRGRGGACSVRFGGFGWMYWGKKGRTAKDGEDRAAETLVSWGRAESLPASRPWFYPVCALGGVCGALRSGFLGFLRCLKALQRGWEKSLGRWTARTEQ